MNSINKYLIFIWFCFQFSGCVLNNDADIEFPEIEQKLMMECYLTPGKNFEMRLMEANSFQDDLVLQLTWNADAFIKSNDQEVELLNILNANNTTNYVFNYGTSDIVPADYLGNYTIQVTTKNGEHIRATTPTVEFIPIKEAKEIRNEVCVSFNVPLNTKQKYFTIIAEGESDKERKLIIENFDGSLWAEEEIIVSLRGDFETWKNLKIKLLHITSDYYEFRESVDDAYSANIDPFTVPTKIDSNVDGGIGIFTFYTIDSLILR
ncbi:MAG: DUF4249 domain-containing protein [Marinifilum sp.]|jgi:hypothetical protein|nr:DUF4249 domain-containing protein [Marinifilum sp.]